LIECIPVTDANHSITFNKTVHIVESCRLTKLNGGLSQLHSADDDAIIIINAVTVNRIYHVNYCFETFVKMRNNGI